jgi:hypothetical protein
VVCLHRRVCTCMCVGDSLRVSLRGQGAGSASFHRVQGAGPGGWLACVVVVCSCVSAAPRGHILQCFPRQLAMSACVWRGHGECATAKCAAAGLCFASANKRHHPAVSIQLPPSQDSSMEAAAIARHHTPQSACTACLDLNPCCVLPTVPFPDAARTVGTSRSRRHPRHHHVSPGASHLR